MGTENNYWLKKVQGGGLTRRRFVGGAAVAGVGVAGLGLVGCGGSSSSSTPTAKPAASSAAGSPSAAASASPAASPTPTPKAGGVWRTSSANATYDTFDASRSRFTPFAFIVGLANQRIIQWDSFKKGVLGGAFASKWEQPDQTTLVLTLRPNNYWQNKPPVNGRLTQVEDMKFHIDRNKAGVLQNGKKDPNFYRYADYQIVESTTITDPSTLTVKFKQPAPLFLNLLAQSYEVVQAPEAVKEFESTYNQFKAAQIMGTGPYELTAFNPDGHLTFKKFDKYYGTTYLAGHQEVPLFTDQAALQAAFEQKQVDQFSPSTVAQLNDLMGRLKGKIFDSPGFSANPIAGTWALQGPPWNDLRLVGAICRAYDRRQLIQQFHGGRGAISGSVPPTQGAFAIDEKELSTYPGYLEDRAKEITDAKALWAAAGGDKLGDVTLDVPDLFEGVYQASAVLTAMLNKNLGTTQFKAKVENYATISTKVSQAKYGNGSANTWYGWITELTDPEPSSNLVSNFESNQINWKQYGLKLPDADVILAKLAVELNADTRKGYCQAVDRILLKNYGAGVQYSHVQIVDTLNWNYFHPAENAPFSTAHLIVNQWIDPADPTYQGRPADPTL